MECMYRDGLNPYTHPTSSRPRTLIYSFYKYRTFLLVLFVLILKSALILTRHLLFPLLRLDDSRVAIAVFATVSDNLVVLLLAVVYRPQMESSVFLSGTTDDSDFIVMVSVVLTKRMWLSPHSITCRKPEDRLEKTSEFVVLFPGEDNYGFAQKSFLVDSDDKSLFLSPPPTGENPN